MKDKIQNIFRDVLDNDTLVINENTTFNEIKDWDSTNLIDVLMAIENDFNIKVKIEDAQDIKNIGDIFTMVKAKIK